MAMHKCIAAWCGRLVVLTLLASAIWWVYREWHFRQAATAPGAADHVVSHDEATGAVVTLSPVARKNLQLVVRPLELTTFWRTLELPGILVERPGVGDRGVVAPIAGVVTEIHALPGASVAPEAPLFSVRLTSESLHASQLELFKATKEIEIARRQYKRLAEVASAGALAQSRVIEIENQLERLEVMVEAYRQDLQARGLSANRIDAATRGEFVTEIIVRAPSATVLTTTDDRAAPEAVQTANELAFSFEIQTLNVHLGEQVEAGQVLCHLADHRVLYIEGQGFKSDVPWLQEAAKHGWPIELEMNEDGPSSWPPLPRALRIEYLANVANQESRTFAFYLTLENQWQTYDQDGQPRTLWRFRPGTRVRLRVPVERFDDVFVIPQAGVVREDASFFIFRQNGDLFDRREIHVLYEDRRHVVVAGDGELRPGFYIAQNAAAALNRATKAQAASGLPAGMHVHADGTMHGAH